jgi:hypothetical protein
MEEPKFLDLLSRVSKNPALIDSYEVRLNTTDNYLTRMDLKYLLHCATAAAPREWLADATCINKISSGFVAVSQEGRLESSAPCLFDPVTNRLPEVVCAGDYYLVWPRLRGARKEFSTPYQLQSVEIVLKEI